MNFLKLVLRAISIFFQTYINENIKRDTKQGVISSHKSNLVIGQTEEKTNACPYCGTVLKKFPKAKTTCKACAQSIYIRTRPSDLKKIMVLENQLDLIEEEWTKVYGTHDSYVAEKKKNQQVENSLKQKLGKTPTKDQIIWQTISDDIVLSASKKDWHGYVSAKREASLYLAKTKHYKAAMLAAFEVCYYDTNILYNAWDKEHNMLMKKTNGGQIEDHVRLPQKFRPLAS